MLTTFVPSLFLSWGTALLLFRVFRSTQHALVRAFLRIVIFLAAAFVGLAGGLCVFTLALWAMSGMSWSTFMNAPLDIDDAIDAWARLGPSGALAGTLIGLFRRWPEGPGLN